MEQASTSSSRATECCSSMTLAKCRRLQVLVFALICAVYCIFVVKTLAVTFHMHWEDKSCLRNTGVSSGVNYYCVNDICVFKCCPAGEGLDSLKDKICASESLSSRNDSERLVKNVLGIMRGTMPEDHISIGYFIYTDACMSIFRKKVELNGKSLDAIGTLSIGYNIYVLNEDFCVDILVGTDLVVISGCGNPVISQYALGNLNYNIFIIIIVIISAISNLLMLFTLLVHIYVPRLRNTHGNIVVCFLASVLLFHITIVFNLFFFFFYPKNTYVDQITFIIGIASLFSWMTWLTLMCFDIWNTFSQPLRAHPHLSQDSRKFRMYSMFGWSIIILLCILESPFYFIHPSSSIAIVYVYITVTLNFTMFLASLINLRFHTVSTSPSSRHGVAAKQGCVLYAKLSMFMGLDWLFILFSYLFFGLRIVILIVECQGIGLFILLICNKRVFRLIRDQWKKRQTGQNEGNEPI